MSNDDGNGHRQVGYLKTYDEGRLRNLKIHLQDFLFDKGHQINKPLIDDLALFVYDLNEVHYAQGQMKPISITTTDNQGTLYVDARDGSTKLVTGERLGSKQASTPSPSPSEQEAL